MSTITNGTTTITPQLIQGYETTTQSTNITHTILGRSDPDYSLGADTPRSGSLSLFFLTRAEAWAAHQLHTAAGVFTLTDADLPEINMRYIRAGSMGLTLDSDTLTRWVLDLEYVEVLS
jgi:hypothetical protein